MEHLSQKQFDDYARQQLSPAELLSVSDHLGECEACREQIKATMNEDAIFLTLHSETFNGEGPGHLTTEQIAGYVDQHLSGESLQVVSDHVGTCEQCTAAVADLREFRNKIAPSLDRDYQPQTVSAPRSESWWRRTFSSFFRVSPLPAFGGAALAVLLLAVIAWLMLRKQSEQRPNQELVVAPAPSLQPTVIPSAVPSPPESIVIVAQLNDGDAVFTLDQQGKLSGADKLSPDYQNLIKKALIDQRIERSSQLKGLARPSSALMGSENKKGKFSVIEPVGTVVMSDRPAFRWSNMDGASYVVEVYDSKFNLVTKSLQLTNNSWTVPQSLARGEIYSWQVKAMQNGQEVTSPGPPAPQAKFRILGQAKANELAKARRAYASSHLTLALLYADAGLLKESEEQLRLLLRANPNSEIARKLLQQIRALH